MSGNLKRKRLRLFERGAASIRAHTDPPADVYVCPICCVGYTRAQLDEGLLTLEHVPPENQGGRGIALTCKPCNSRGGHQVDAEARKVDEVLRFQDALLEQRESHAGVASLTVEGKRLHVDYEIRGRDITLVPRPGNNPRYLGPEGEFWPGPNGMGVPIGGTIRFTPKIRFDGWLARVGNLRTAYLAAFAKFGYGYALDDRLTPIREQILNPTERRVLGFWLDLDHDGETSPQMGFFRKPVPCLLVRVNRRAVLLPWVEGPAWVYPYPAAEPLRDDRLELVDGDRIPWPRTLELLRDGKPEASSGES